MRHVAFDIASRRYIAGRAETGGCVGFELELFCLRYDSAIENGLSTRLDRGQRETEEPRFGRNAKTKD